MTPGSRARFVEAYSTLVADVWSDPRLDDLLEQDPAAMVARYDIELPDQVGVELVRSAGDAAPDLDLQVRCWQQAEATGVFTLYVPMLDPISDTELAEHELDDVVAGMDSSCACCCPCCCS